MKIPAKLFLLILVGSVLAFLVAFFAYALWEDLRGYNRGW